MPINIATFDDWMDLFYKWQKNIGFDASVGAETGLSLRQANREKSEPRETGSFSPS